MNPSRTKIVSLKKPLIEKLLYFALLTRLFWLHFLLKFDKAQNKLVTYCKNFSYFSYIIKNSKATSNNCFYKDVFLQNIFAMNYFPKGKNLISNCLFAIRTTRI